MPRKKLKIVILFDRMMMNFCYTPGAHDNNECVKADGSSYLNLRANSNSTSNETGASPLNTSKGQGNGLATGQNGTTPVTASAAKTRLINGTTVGGDSSGGPSTCSSSLTPTAHLI